MQADEFWSEARRRRNHLLLVWLGWFFVGGPLWGIYSSFLSSSDPMAAAVAALLTWGAVWISVALRLKSLRCFRCGRRPFDHPYFSMSQARCGHCGIARRGE